VPNTAQEYWVDNETTGAFTLDVMTAGQVAPAPVVVPQGNQKIVQCDGTNVIPGDSTSVSFPISVANGGTGATTASGARTNLGATTVGNNVFTAASVAAAQAALSVPPTSRLISTSGLLQGGGDLSADRSLSLLVDLATVSRLTDVNLSGAGVVISWNNEITDQGAWHDNAVNPSRLTVPAGVAFAEISVLMVYSRSAVATDVLVGNVEIHKNGGFFCSAAAVTPTDATSASYQFNTLYCTTGPIAVTPGDYFEVNAIGFTKSAATVILNSVSGSNVQSKFMAKALG